MEMPSIEKLAAAADKLTAHAGKPKRKRRKAGGKRKSPKRVKISKKAARLPTLSEASKKHKSLVDRKFALDQRYSKGKMTRKQYTRSLRPLVRAIKKAEATLRGGRFRYDWE